MLPRLDYARPTSPDEAAWMLTSPGARPLAGGQGLIPDLRSGRDSAELLVDLTGLKGMRSIRRTEDGKLQLGALVTLADLAADPTVRAEAAALAEAAAAVGDHQVRHRATLGGALLHRDSGLDLPAAALALDARLEVRLSDRTVSITADQDLPAGGLLTSVEIPAAGGASAYERQPHPAGHRAVVGVAAWIGLDGDAVSACRIGVTGAGPRPLRLGQVEQAVQKGALDGALGEAAGQDAAGFDLPSDLVASGEYRAHLVGVLAERAVERALAAARTGGGAAPRNRR